MDKDKVVNGMPYVDHLTGLRTRDGLFHDYGDQSLEGIHFIYVDIDDFNRMNMIFGVDTVEDMLKSVADSLLDYCGKSDVYRYGNDQFVLLTKSHIICEPAELQTLLKQPFQHHHIQYVINASVCVADYDDFKGDSLKDMMKLMSMTVDLTKSEGRNSLVYADYTHKQKYLEIREVETNIYDAMRKKEFYPKFRPFVDTFNGEVIGFEAVARWNLNGKELKPNRFLEIAQWTGIIYDIEMCIFENSLRFYRKLIDDKEIKLSPRFKCGVNLSSYTIIKMEIETILELLGKYEIMARDVILEIKETDITDINVLHKVQNLYELGFLIVLDDYTNKSSSLTYLADLKVDSIKLSESLIRDINDSEEFMMMQHLYQFYVDLSRKFDLAVIAAGIRNKQDHRLVVDMGVEIGQGEYFSKPLSISEYVEYIKNNKKRRFRR